MSFLFKIALFRGMTLTFSCGSKLSGVTTAEVILCRGKGFPTNLPTNRLKQMKTLGKRIIWLVKQTPPNPLQCKRFGGMSWHEWVRTKKQEGFLVRMRSAVQIRPAAPEKHLKSSDFGCFSLLFGTISSGSNCGSTVCPTRRPQRRKHKIVPGSTI